MLNTTSFTKLLNQSEDVLILARFRNPFYENQFSKMVAIWAAAGASPIKYELMIPGRCFSLRSCEDSSSVTYMVRAVTKIMTLEETDTASHHCPEYLDRKASTEMCICLLHHSRGSSSHRSACGPWISYRSQAYSWDGTTRRRCIWEELRMGLR